MNDEQIATSKPAAAARRGDRQCRLSFVFFFQAEDGIRDYKVTGVQTCALPIWRGFGVSGDRRVPRPCPPSRPVALGPPLGHNGGWPRRGGAREPDRGAVEGDMKIGRASCRERV